VRNPVAAIRAQAEASLGAEEPSAMHAGLSSISASATRLSRLVDQLLALARLDAARDRIFFTNVDLVNVAKQALAETAPSAIQHGATIDFEGPDSAIVSGNASLLTAMIRNLVENAAIHNGAGVHIATRVDKVDGAYELTTWLVSRCSDCHRCDQQHSRRRRASRDKTGFEAIRRDLRALHRGPARH
jgi:two-component system sensor histidine kinase QseC